MFVPAAHASRVRRLFLSSQDLLSKISLRAGRLEPRPLPHVPLVYDDACLRTGRSQPHAQAQAQQACSRSGPRRPGPAAATDGEMHTHTC